MSTPHGPVHIERLTRFYEEAGERHYILRDATITFEGGRFTVLLGKSGSGKSTLLNLLSGIDTPDSGTVRVGDTEVTALAERERTLFRRDHIGIIFQFFNLVSTLTVLENVMLPSELAGRPWRAVREAALEQLRNVGLEHRAGAMPDRLSGGEQQRVAIARALVHQPHVVLADEPTGNLDEQTGLQVLELLLHLTRKAGRTLVMATHSLDVVPLADAIFTVHDGHLQPYMPPP